MAVRTTLATLDKDFAVAEHEANRQTVSELGWELCSEPGARMYAAKRPHRSGGGASYDSAPSMGLLLKRIENRNSAAQKAEQARLRDTQQGDGE